MSKQAASETAPAEAAVDRLSYNPRTNKSVQGAGELLDALAGNKLKIEAIDQKQLPPEFQNLGRDELEKRIAKAREDRAAVDQLARERDSYLRIENKRLAVAGKGDAFDGKVAQTIHDQVAKKGIHYAP